MIIGIDGFKLGNSKELAGKRSREIVRHLAENFPTHDFFIYTPKYPKIKEAIDLEGLHNIRFCLPPPSGFGGKLWRMFGITNNLPADKVDFYLGIDGELPLNIKLSGIPAILMIADIDFFKKKSFFERKFYDYTLRHSLKNASKIIVPSPDIKEQIGKFYVISQDNIMVSTDLKNLENIFLTIKK